MKSGSDNFRQSAVQDIIHDLHSSGIEIIIHEPTVQDSEFYECRIVNDVEQFGKLSDIILANRKDSLLSGIADKVYTRDIFNDN